MNNSYFIIRKNEIHKILILLIMKKDVFECQCVKPAQMALGILVGKTHFANEKKKSWIVP